MSPPDTSHIAPGIEADDDVRLGYRSGRAGAAPLLLGGGARLRSGTVVYDGCRIGERFQTGHHVVIREGTVIGDDVVVWSNAVVDYGCELGDRVKIHSNCYVAQYSRLAADTFLAPGVTFANDLYPGQGGSADVMTGPTVEAGAQIGVNATVLPFVTIGAGAMIGAGSVVTRDVPPGMVAYGCPAVAVGEVADLDAAAERVQRIPGDGRRYRLRPGQEGSGRATRD